MNKVQNYMVRTDSIANYIIGKMMSNIYIFSAQSYGKCSYAFELILSERIVLEKLFNKL